MKRRIIGLVLAVCIAGSSFAYDSITERQFEIRLDDLSRQRDRQVTVMASGVGMVLVGALAASVFATLDGAELITRPAALWGSVGSYTVAGLGIGVSTFGFARWKQATDDYLETLRLQTRYWTLVRPR